MFISYYKNTNLRFELPVRPHSVQNYQFPFLYAFYFGTREKEEKQTIVASIGRPYYSG